MATKSTRRQGKRTDSSLETELKRIVKEGVAEAHNEGVQHKQSGRSGSGRSSLPLLFVAGALAVAAILVWRRSSSSQSGQGGGVAERIRKTAKQAAERTDEMSEMTAQRVEKSGESVAERTDEMSERAAHRVAEGGENVAERTDEMSEAAARRVEEKGDEASSKMEDAAESGDESGAAGSR